MATRLASSQPSPMATGQHTSGIYSDMTVDGPEIGTLVLIVDRAKNLPNRKAMGKQNPYCAARLGKEAKKTETDKRGGQTPKWDQELRFVVHDSLDYHNLKLSVFSEDKKTDLVGEAWINLDKVITAGGGKCDLWQTLNCKGKYSGEIRIELTYYDSRPRPEKKVVQEEVTTKQPGSDKFKRRPLPTGPAGASRMSPANIPNPAVPGRARHGPRDLQTPLRSNSLPQETTPQPQSVPQQPAQSYYQQDQHFPAPLQHMHSEPTLPIPLHTEYEEKYTDLRTHSEPYVQPDFLPTLPPTNRQRGGAMHDSYHLPMQTPLARPLMSAMVPHAHSAPAIPQQQDFHPETDLQSTLYTNAPEPLHDLDYQHSYVQQRHRLSDADRSWDHRTHDDQFEPQQHYQHHAPPPPPPMHSRSTSSLPNSAPMTPREHIPYDHSRTSSAGRPISRGHQQYVSDISPLQSIEQNRFHSHESTGYRPLPRDNSDAEMAPSPHQAQPRRSQYDTPPQRRAPAFTPDSTPHRHSISTPYTAPGFRQSPHPLSQELPRARSPMPELHERQYPAMHDEREYYQAELNRNAITPVIRPRAISPSRQTASDGPARPEWRPKNTYSIQSPIRAFESSDDSPLSHSRPRHSAGTTRKSVSPHPSPSQPRLSSSIPYGPDSFDVHNPTAATTMTRDDPPSGPITGWDGREIDPSDHLPVASWAPEPEVKTPIKTYGLGRDRDFGPRSAESANNARFSRDTVVNVHRKGASAESTPANTIRARLVKKSQHTSQHGSAQSSPVAPLSEHPNYNPVPDPYDQADYSRGYMGGHHSPPKPRYSTGGYAGQNHGYGPPDLPPKVPLDAAYGHDSYGPDALSREIASIDIGAGGPRHRASVPAPVAYVPVRSHRDRDSFY